MFLVFEELQYQPENIEVCCYDSSFSCITYVFGSIPVYMVQTFQLQFEICFWVHTSIYGTNVPDSQFKSTSNCRILCYVFAKNLQSLSESLQAQSQGISIEIPGVAHAAGYHPSQWEGLSLTAKLIQQRFIIFAGAARMTLDAESEPLWLFDRS